jgi:hypothetical protein
MRAHLQKIKSMVLRAFDAATTEATCLGIHHRHLVLSNVPRYSISSKAG